MIYNIEKLVDVIGGISAQISNPGAMIERVIIDSRQVSTPNHTIFIAIVGKRKDGHTFIGSLYDQGIRNFIISEPCSYGQYPQANFVLVENGVTALQTWARVHRSQFDIPIVGVTGSNGKTIVKEWLHHLMVPDFFVTKSPKSYNSQIGVPLSVLQLTAASELAIFEAGISQPGEMVRLEQIIHPQLGIFTNLGSAHDQGFNSRLQKAKEKALFFRSSDLVVCCREHQLIRRALQELQIQMFTWSMSDHEADLFISGIEVEHNQTSIWYKADRSDGLITIPFVDQVSIENALHCLALMIVLEMPQAAFEGKFSNLQPVAMRLEAVKGINGCQIINDVYNADLESIQGALAFTDQQTDLSKKTIVLSDLQQLTDDKSTLYRQVADMVRAKGFSRFIGVGNDIRRIKPHLSNSTNSAFYRNTEELLTDLPNLHFDQELILIKGARNYGLEEVTKRLSAQRHSTVLEINLAALARNLKVMEGYLNPQTKIMAMVKAAAYGSGAIEIGRMLVSRRIDYLAVAYPDEGVELRNAGITLPVVILNPEIDSLALLVRYKLEPEIFSLTDLQFTRGWTDKNKQTLDIHLKIDSGMHRQGLQADDVDQVIGCIKDSLFLKVKSIFSHLSASDEPEQDSFTLQQIELFDKTANR
ncbi:MAG: alanine racemase, partial [Saprospiraceae bacterium]|nr:alanine racemase [Saprospiraceae bacterium]